MIRHMSPSIQIQRSKHIQNTYQAQTTILELNGPIGSIQMRIRSRLSPRQRRTVGIAFMRQIRPFLEYFSTQSIYHTDHEITDFNRNDQRGLNLFSSADFSSKNAQCGFEIRMRRLEKGLSQQDLATQSGLSNRHLSKIERGICRPTHRTRMRLDAILG